MNCIARRVLPAFLLCVSVPMIVARAQAQATIVSTRPAITVLDSNKEQDGLLGSVRRVKTETARIELKDGRSVEGPTQLVEVTTYGIKGNRIENTSYPTGDSLVGKEEYKYDERGNITEMTVRDDKGAILSREAYTYEFDKFGNWIKMVTSLVVFENGELKQEPVEVTHRTVTYYFDDSIAKIIDEPKAATAPAIPEPANSELRDQDVLDPGVASVSATSLELGAEPPPLLVSVKSVSSVAEDKPAADAADSTSAEAQLKLGHEFLKLQKDREAIKAFKESIKLNPDIAETYYGLGFSNFRLGRFKDAADAFKKATTLEPKMAKAHYGLSLAYQELGMTTLLLDEYRTLERLDKNLAKRLVETFPQFNFSCRIAQGCP